MNHDLPLNEYHIKSSHNTFGIKFFWDNVQRIKYIKEFLNAGFRGLEIDVYFDRKKRTKVAHHGLNLSFSRPSLQDYLDQIQEWRNKNPDHLPILLQIEANHPIEYEGLAHEILSILLNNFQGDSLLTPPDLEKFRTEHPGSFWPKLNDLRGKLIINTQTDTHTAYYEQKEDGSEDLAKNFFTTANNEYFADYSYRKLKWNSKVNIENLEKLRNDVEQGKLVRVIPSSKFILFWKRSIMDINACLDWSVHLLAVDRIKELKTHLSEPYTAI